MAAPSTRRCPHQRLLGPILAILLAVLPACRRSAPPSATPFAPLPVTVVVVAPRDIAVTFDYLGKTAGSREVEVRARVSGFLDRRHFVEGAMVAAGEPLFEIDPKPLQAQATAAAAEVAVADARWQQGTREAKRLEGLVADQAASQKELDDAVSATLVAKAQLASAQARLEQIELDLKYTHVTAPIAGKIGRALQPEGSLVDQGPSGLLTTLLQLDPIYVDFHRTENQQFAFDGDLASGRLSLPASGQLAVEVQHRDGTVLASGGTIDFTAGRLEPTTGTIPMRATLPNPEQRLRAGQAVKVVLRGAVLRAALTVPQRAVVESPRGKAVMVAVDKDGGTVFEPRVVEVGEWVLLPEEGPAARAWVIRKGLAAGDRVILDNLVKLTRMPPGLPVAIVPPNVKVQGGKAN